MIKVELKAHTNIDPFSIASHAALICYQAEAPEMGKLIDVETRLFKPGHHTTLQHFFLTFVVEGIAVGDITFGLHLVHPFYNSDQRSGRYCAKMFLEPNYKEIENYVRTFWPEVNGENMEQVMMYIKKGVGLYHANIAQAGELAKIFLKAERPYVSEKSLETNGPKIAQEQMRMFIPVIFPTAFDFTINLTVLAAIYRTAWTPAMRYVVDEMVKAVLEKFPELEFMFKDKSNKDWAMAIPSVKPEVKYQPEVELLGIIGEEDFIIPDAELMHPVDQLHFRPELMDNSFGSIMTRIEISTATMGQDQRHRTISRSEPKFTGDFYLPPILKEMSLENEALGLMEEWVKLSHKIPKSLSMILAPYGAIVTYKKRGSFNAIAHEQAKRLCWCAQEEIYHAGRSLKLQIEKTKGEKLARMFEPPCYRKGICAEGARYCGREIKIRETGDYFPERKV
jgi:thymidylate synthase ThyX